MSIAARMIQRGSRDSQAYLPVALDSSQPNAIASIVMGAWLMISMDLAFCIPLRALLVCVRD